MSSDDVWNPELGEPFDDDDDDSKKPSKGFIEFLNTLVGDIFLAELIGQRGQTSPNAWCGLNTITAPLPPRWPLDILFKQVRVDWLVPGHAVRQAMPLVAVIPLSLLSSGRYIQKRQSQFHQFVECNGAN